MNSKEVDKITRKIAKYVAHKFKDIYPDAFVHCTTTDLKTYKNSNPCIYSWYLKALNGIQNLDFSPQYQQTDEECFESNWDCVERFFLDITKTDNFLKFLIENVKT